MSLLEWVRKNRPRDLIVRNSVNLEKEGNIDKTIIVKSEKK